MEISNGQAALKRRARIGFDGQFVTITRGMFRTSQQRIPVSKITSVRYSRKALGGGVIEFIAPDVDGRVEFTPWVTSQIEQLRDQVEAAIA